MIFIFQVTYGYSKDKRPDLKQFVLSTLCVDRAVPIWGKADDGNASDKARSMALAGRARSSPARSKRGGMA